MEQNNGKFRLRLNLFDAIVLIAALAVAAFLLWNAFKPAASAPASGETITASSTIRYTIRFQRLMEGTGSLIQPGDALVDTIKNYKLGNVVAVEVVPAEYQILNQESREYVLTTISGYEDALVTVESPCTNSNDTLLLDGGYTLRVGATAYVRGEGYMGSGPIISIEREEQA